MKSYIFIILAIIMINNKAIAKITEIKDLISFSEFLKSQPQNDVLIIFDIDDVLMMPEEDFTLSRNPYREKLWQALQKKLSKQEIELLHSIVTLKAKWCLVDPKIKKIISFLKKNNIAMTALTSFSTGRYGIIDKREDLRMQNLAQMGFDFQSSSPFKKDMVINELAGNHGLPLVKDGIIFTAECDKGLILEHVLLHTNYQPKTIIFIDDQLKNLQSVEKLCNKLNIKFHGFHYIAVSMLPHPHIDIQEEELRMHELEKNHIWKNKGFSHL